MVEDVRRVGLGRPLRRGRIDEQRPTLPGANASGGLRHIGEARPAVRRVRCVGETGRAGVLALADPRGAAVGMYEVDVQRAAGSSVLLRAERDEVVARHRDLPPVADRPREVGTQQLAAGQVRKRIGHQVVGEAGSGGRLGHDQPVAPDRHRTARRAVELGGLTGLDVEHRQHAALQHGEITGVVAPRQRGEGVVAVDVADLVVAVHDEDLVVRDVGIDRLHAFARRRVGGRRGGALRRAGGRVGVRVAGRHCRDEGSGNTGGHEGLDHTIHEDEVLSRAGRAPRDVGAQISRPHAGLWTPDRMRYLDVKQSDAKGEPVACPRSRSPTPSWSSTATR